MPTWKNISSSLWIASSRFLGVIQSACGIASLNCPRTFSSIASAASRFSWWNSLSTYSFADAHATDPVVE
eukprot:262015-Rhodomonas_salina.1